MAVNLVVVDDEIDIFKLYELFLKKEIQSGEVILHTFPSGKECLNFLMDAQVDESFIIFSDINMPEMDGYQLLERVKKNWSFIDVYMISAYSREDYQRRADELGAKQLIAKPVDFQFLKELIESHF